MKDQRGRVLRHKVNPPVTPRSAALRITAHCFKVSPTITLKDSRLDSVRLHYGISSPAPLSRSSSACCGVLRCVVLFVEVFVIVLVVVFVIMFVIVFVPVLVIVFVP